MSPCLGRPFVQGWTHTHTMHKSCMYGRNDGHSMRPRPRHTKTVARSVARGQMQCNVTFNSNPQSVIGCDWYPMVYCWVYISSSCNFHMPGATLCGGQHTASCISFNPTPCFVSAAWDLSLCPLPALHTNEETNKIPNYKFRLVIPG